MGLSEFLTEYWYIVAIIVIIFLIYIWMKVLDNHTKYQLRKFFSGKTLIFIAIVVGWYFWAKMDDIVSINQAHRWMPIIILLLMSSYYFIGSLRYETKGQLKTPNFHGSYKNAPYRVNGFLIYGIDTFDTGGLSWDYAKRIAIIREETCELMDEGSVSIANMGHISKYELPEELREFITKNKFLKKATDEVYYGWFDSIEEVDWEFSQLKKLEEEKKINGIYTMLKKELEVSNPKVSTLYWLYKNQSKSVNKQTEWYDATVESTEKGVEHQKRVKDAYGGGDKEPISDGGSEEQY
jgi:hypothetical protein